MDVKPKYDLRHAARTKWSGFLCPVKQREAICMSYPSFKAS